MIAIFFWATMLVCCSIVPVLLGLRDYQQHNSDCD